MNSEENSIRIGGCVESQFLNIIKTFHYLIIFDNE